MPEQYDIVIVGGGMVGATLACALGDSSLQVAVIESREPAPFDPSRHDLRVSAVTRASQRIFEMLGAWRGMTERRACPFRRMLVWDSEGGGEAQFDSADIAEPNLGHIVENGVIQLALREALGRFENIEWLCPAELGSLDLENSRIDLADGRTISARLIVAADGARSKVRELASIECKTYDYNQHALVATVHTELPQQDITWQRHLPTGPQAFLPLTGQCASLVWYHSPDEVKRLQGLDDDVFIRELEQHYPSRLGGVGSVEARGSFPIRRLHAEKYVLPGLALVGDAAHVIHPHIGQGVNLGLLDAATLAEVILDAHHKGKAFAGHLVLRRYERWRKAHNLALIAFAEGVFHAFAHQTPPLPFARSALFNIADKVAPINHLCIRYAMGLMGDLPRLAQGHHLHPGTTPRLTTNQMNTPL